MSPDGFAACAPKDRVVAVGAVDCQARFHGVRAEQGAVGELQPLDLVVVAAIAEPPLDGDAVAAASQDYQEIGPRPGKADGIDSHPLREADRVAAPAPPVVVADGVVAGTVAKDVGIVVLRGTVKIAAVVVTAVAAIDAVVAGAAVDQVVAGPGIYGVVTVAPGNQIIPPTGIDGIVAPPAGDDIVSAIADDSIGGLGAGQEPVADGAGGPECAVGESDLLDFVGMFIL